MIDLNGFIIFTLGTVFGILMASTVSDLVFPPTREANDENDQRYSYDSSDREDN